MLEMEISPTVADSGKFRPSASTRSGQRPGAADIESEPSRATDNSGCRLSDSGAPLPFCRCKGGELSRAPLLTLIVPFWRLSVPEEPAKSRS